LQSALENSQAALEMPVKAAAELHWSIVCVVIVIAAIVTTVLNHSYVVDCDVISVSLCVMFYYYQLRMQRMQHGNVFDRQHLFVCVFRLTSENLDLETI